MDLQHNEWAALAALATFLGARRGFDADRRERVERAGTG